VRRVQVLPLLSGYLNVQPYIPHDTDSLTIYDEIGTSKVAPGMEVHNLYIFLVSPTIIHPSELPGSGGML
jgi:hypothetical protein